MKTIYNIKEYNEVHDFMNDFFRYYYTERDSYKIEQMASETILSIGLMEDEIGYDKASFHQFVNAQMMDVKEKIPYRILDYTQCCSTPGIWNVYTRIMLSVFSKKWGLTSYDIRLSATVENIEGQWKISLLHCSEIKMYPRRGNVHKDATESVQNEIGRIMSDIVPGGIISRYAKETFPISIANTQLLQMLGYMNMQELMDDCGGSYIQLLHPEDVEKYLYTVRFIGVTGKQCECEYRIRCKNDTYIWVRDTGRKAVSIEGKDLIVSILSNIEDHIARQKKLEAESKMDPLTQVYNRKGAYANEVGIPKNYRCYAFYVVDIDNFKKVNDFYGHVEGDQVLVFLAKLLKQEFKDLSIICRLGGDEFSIFTVNFESLQEIETKLKRIVDSYCQYMYEHCSMAESTLSIGGVIGNQITDIRAVYEKADMNMYKIKYTSKNGIYTTEMDKK